MGRQLYNGVMAQVVPIKSTNRDLTNSVAISVGASESKESDVINVHSDKAFATAIFEIIKTGGSPSAKIEVKYRKRGSNNWSAAYSVKATFSVTGTHVIPIRLDAVLAQNWLPNTEMIYVITETAGGGSFTVEGEHGA